MTIDVRTLFTVETAASILARGLDLAQALGLPVTSWRTGDPTRSLYKYLAEVLATLEPVVSEYVKAGFLSSAEGDWLTVLASEVYGVERTEATAATPSVTLTNGGGGLFTFDAGDVTCKASASGATFHSTDGGTLAPLGTLTLALVADVAGSDGTVATNEVDTLVTTLLGVSITASTAAIGLDEQDDDALKEDCRDTRGALSPDGPADAYEYVARQAALTGVGNVTRSRSTQDGTTGLVTVYIAGPDGAVGGPTVTAVQSAIDTWATPLCVTPTVASATETVINVTATISGVDVPADYQAQIETALGAYFATLQIADEAGDTAYRSPILAAIHDTIPLRNVVLTVPASDTAYAEGFVPALGVVSITEV